VNEPDIPVLDAAVLEELSASVGGDRGFVVELIRTYFDDTESQLAQIEAALAAEDASALIRPAHTLKSSSATLGAERLADRARALEIAGRSERIDDESRADGEKIREDWQDAKVALQEWTTRSDAS
ncbi:MAG: Hpt domain-containing protein, partial [Candidatus Limnocylindria bacterium]